MVVGEGGCELAGGARVGEQGDTGRLGGVDDDLVLSDAALVELVARDQQHLVAGREEAVEGGGRVVVGDREPYAPGREVGGLGLVTYDGGDLLGRDLLQQLLDDVTAEVSGGSGDDNAHDVHLLVGCG